MSAMQRTFDRVKRVDPASEVYRVATIFKSAEDKVLQAEIDGALSRIDALEHAQPSPVPTPTPPKPPALPSFWQPRYTLDQGPEGECVGFGCAGTVGSAPIGATLVVNLDKSGQETETSTAERIYTGAQAHDGSPPDEQSGASVLGGVQTLHDLGLISSYHQAMTVAECVAALVSHGPLVIGVDWYAGMMDVDPAGYIAPTGAVQGGHCVEVDYISADRTVVAIHNSWGTGWGVTIDGVSGHAYLKLTDFARLLAAQGEAWLVAR